MNPTPPIISSEWLLVFATELEWTEVRKHLSEGTLDSYAGVLITGIGTLNAAMSLTRALEARVGQQLPLPGILNVGIAGAPETGRFRLGKSCVASQEWLADCGVLTADATHPIEEIGIPLYPEQPEPWNSVPVSSVPSEAVSKALGIPLCPFFTVNAVSGDKEIAVRRSKEFPGALENMEGAALAYVAQQFGARFVEIRAISNWLGDRDKSRWEFAKCFRSLADALTELVSKEPIRLEGLDS